MKVIGITGGVGSGKSRVLSYMEEKFSAVICQADHVAWELQAPGQDCYHHIVEQFGKRILLEDSTIDRRELAKIVFADKTKLAMLNGIMHPAVKKQIIEQIDCEESKGTSLFVIEAALLLEDNYKEICDEIWYVYTEESVKRQRLKDSRSYDDNKIDAIMKNQLSDASFREQCQVVIDNSGDFVDTCYQINKAIGEHL